MSDVQLEIQLVAAIVAASCAISGVFLVLRKLAMMSDAISHAILLGIVVAFFWTEDLNSPWLILGAAVTGVLTVALVEMVHRTRLLKEDAAMGLVFPALFSIGVILIAKFAGDVHLDTDAVLLGELAFVPFDRLVIAGIDLPKAFWVMLGAGVLNALFLVVFYKELKLATFDAGLAAALGFAPVVLHYALMALVSVTAVAAFDAVGSILVVALMVGPPAAAHLLTDRLARMIGISVALGVLSAIGGYWLAHVLDASIAGAMATMVGVCFLVAFLFAPHRGMVAVLRRRARQRWTFAEKMLTVHLLHHEGLPEAARENRVAHLQEHLSWDGPFAERVVKFAQEDDLVVRSNGDLRLTEEGRTFARKAIVDI